MLPQIDPIPPKLVRDVPRERRWLYELKLDGFRGTLYVEQQRGRFLSKTKKRMKRFDALANAITRERGARDAILDGEIVVMTDATTEWFKVKHAEYSQKEGPAGLFHGRAT